MNRFTLAAITCGFLILTGCVNKGGEVITPDKRSDKDYDDKKAKDQNRLSVFERAKQRYGSDICAEEDKGHECENTCKSIYRRKVDKEDCLKLPVGQIEKLEELISFCATPVWGIWRRLIRMTLMFYLNVVYCPF